MNANILERYGSMTSWSSFLEFLAKKMEDRFFFFAPQLLMNVLGKPPSPNTAYALVLSMNGFGLIS